MRNTSSLFLKNQSILDCFLQLSFLLLLSICSNFVKAQEITNIPNLQLDYIDQLSQQPERSFSPAEKIPPAPHESQIVLPAPPAKTSDQLSDQLKIQVKHIELSGNTVFSDQQLKQFTEPYEGREISSFDLFNLRNALNLYYINQGYINSGAIIPDQNIADGIIKILIVEGQLNQIIISGNDWLEQDYMIERLRLGNENILNLDVLQERIKIIHQNPLIKRINAELIPGEKPGESQLQVAIEEQRPYKLNIAFNNLRNPSVGELQGVIYGEFMNLTGHGDSLSAHFSITEGLNNGGVFYALPISAYDTKIYAFYENTDAEVIEAPFENQDIKSTISSFGIGIEQPYYFSPYNKFLASLLFERRTSQTNLFGQPYSFSPGPVEGKSRISALRMIGEWLYQQANHVIAIRSTFSVGLDVLDATQHNGNIPDGQYFAWLGQFQWVQRIADTGIKLLLRSNVQLTPNSLLPMEKMGVGGYYSVRGYRENQLVRDNGFVSSIEARFPLFRLLLPGLAADPGAGNLEFALFYDFGWSENNQQFNADPRANTLSSVGVGLRWDPHSRIHSELYWGYGLRKVDTFGDNSLQDNGLQFILDLSLF